MPTLYAGDEMRKPKPNVTEFALYNMASMLAAVATGYDVRMSNVSPVHPKLQPQLISAEQENMRNLDPATAAIQAEYIDSREFVGDGRNIYAHNTYHGPTKHIR